MKVMDIAEIIDRRAHMTVGYFISSKYEKFILPVIEKIDREEKLAKLHKLKNHQDLEFAEIGVDDGIK
jgi:predicted MarR family transcription regulator